MLRTGDGAMSSVSRTAAAWAADGIAFGRAVLVRVSGPSAFEVGSTLLVGADGRIAGGVSPGCAEGAAVEAVTAARLGGYREVISLGPEEDAPADAPGTCGGRSDVLIEPSVPQALVASTPPADPIAVATTLPAGREFAQSAYLTVDGTGRRSCTLGDPALDAEAAGYAIAALRDGRSRVVDTAQRRVFIEVVNVPHLVIEGAGDIAVHLARLAHAIGYRTTVIDARAAYASRDRFPDADAILVGWADELAERASIDDSTFVAAIAHDPKHDDPAIIAALARGAAYVGALGSRRTHAARLRRLAAAGVPSASLARIHGPIGLALGARTAPELAVSILAEIVRERRQSERPRAEDGTAVPA